MKLPIAAVLGLAVIAAPAAGLAHFALLQPQSAVVEDKLGNPQKAGPCGVTADQPGMPSGFVTAVVGGSLLHVKVKETIYHPGFYRVALSVMDRAELPADPADTTMDGPKGPMSMSGKIDPHPKPPVLVDGLWENHVKHPLGELDSDVKLPNINCDHCSLQVIQFMEMHPINTPGRFSYHHCADLKITANPALPIDPAWPGQVASKTKSKAN